MCCDALNWSRAPSSYCTESMPSWVEWRRQRRRVGRVGVAGWTSDKFDRGKRVLGFWEASPTRAQSKPGRLHANAWAYACPSQYPCCDRIAWRGKRVLCMHRATHLHINDLPMQPNAFHVVVHLRRPGRPRRATCGGEAVPQRGEHACYMHVPEVARGAAAAHVQPRATAHARRLCASAMMRG